MRADLRVAAVGKPMTGVFRKQQMQFMERDDSLDSEFALASSLERLNMGAHMNRIAERFLTMKARGHKGLVVYIGAGDPNLAATEQLAIAMDAGGVDILELGVPFSDPLADGLVNQLAAQRGLESGTTPRKVLETVASIRRRSQIPIILYIYFNLIHRIGMERFFSEAANAGVDGLLILDLPPEESGNYERLMSENGLSVIYLIAPTTPDERIQNIVPRGSGFVYYISREGVTGMRDTVAKSIAAMTQKIRAHTELPIAVGFGISNPDQAIQVAEHAEAVVVGSAIVHQIAEQGQDPNLVPKVSGFVQSLAEAVHGVRYH